jgi:ribosome-associated protein
MPKYTDFFHKNDIPDDDGWVSKSSEKRHARHLRDVAIEILALADSEFDRIPFGDNDSLREAMLVAKKLKPRSEELRRQILHIESLMRVASEDDVKLFENMLKAIKGAKVSENAQFHRLETLRDELIATGMEKINSLMSENPSIDRQKLRALVSKAQKEAEKENSDRRYYRELFQFLKTNINQEQSDE